MSSAPAERLGGGSILSHVPAFAKFVLLFAVLYAGYGVVAPFLPAFLGQHGLTAEQIAIVMAFGTGIRLISGPLAGSFADRKRAWRGVFAACAAGSGALALLYLPAHGFWLLLLVTLAQALLLAPLGPLSDALALSASADGKRFEYGWVRGAASAAFIIGSIVAGHAAGAYGLNLVIWLSAGLLGAAAIAVLPVPTIAEPCGPAPEPAQAGSIVTLLAIPAFRRAMLIAALVLGSHALHDTFVVIHWTAAGISTATSSLLWSEQVAAEVVVFWLIGPPLVHRFGPGVALALAAAAGVLRWAVMGASTHVGVLALVEPLHGFTFALLHLACMRVIGDVVPARLAATAQAVYGTIAGGASTAALTLASGWLYGGLAGQAFWVMALLCALAVPLTRGLISPPPATR